MKNHLKNFMIAVTGDFGQHRTHEKIRQWIELAGGIFAPKIDSDVTHLVASKEHYKKNVLMGMISIFCVCFKLLLGLILL